MYALATFQREYGQFILSGGNLLILLTVFQGKHTIGWLLGIAMVILISFFAWWSCFRRYRAISDTPTSRIASAAQGYVEIIGTGKFASEMPLYSHFTERVVLWSRWEVRERRGRHWETIDSGENGSFLLIDDGSGSCLVDLYGAEILSTRQYRYMSDGQSRVEHYFIPGDKLYAIGEFRTIREADTLNIKTDMGRLLKQWKQDRPVLLKRFDLDCDGEISMKEWALARAAARREINKKHADIRSKSSELHTLSQPPNGQFYLVSNIDTDGMNRNAVNPDRFARRYFWWSWVHLFIFFGCLAIVPWLVSAHEQQALAFKSAREKEHAKVNRAIAVQQEVEWIHERVLRKEYDEIDQRYSKKNEP